jgi:LEA14-like dessication related protein
MRLTSRVPGRLRRAALPLLLLGAALAGLPPAAASGPPRGDVTLTLKEKVIRDLSSAGLTLAFHISASNRASEDLALVRYRYRVVVNTKEFLNMTVNLDQPLTVPAGKELIIALPVKISYGLLTDAVGPVGDQASCDVAGDMFFADSRHREDKVAFAYPGEFPIFKDPEVDLLPLQVNDLTVGGADVVFQARFRNLNRYELVVSRLSFRLLFGGKEVLAGEVPGDKTLPATGEKAFALPFIVDFFEAGRDLRDLFQKPEIPGRFSGEMEIQSAWGKLVIPFDRSQGLTVAK